MRIGALVALSLFAAIAGGAVSAAEMSPLAGMFGNTVHIFTGKDEIYVYFNADGTFTTSGSDGQQIGTWKIVDGKICTKIKTETSCGVIEPGRRVGDEWQHTLDGEEVTIEVVKGR